MSSSDTPKVSVCIPTYNHEAYIVQAVESVLEQRTNFGVELLIGEDCSTDRTRQIVCELAARHPEKVRLRLTEKNQGAGRNFVDLFEHCRGEYVVILEGDDYWTNPAKLQIQADALDARPDWAMCFHPALTVYDDGRPSQLYPEERVKNEYTIYDLFEKDFMATGAVMFRNRLFGKLPDWFVDVVVGDWTLHLLNAVHGNIGYLPEVMSVYRVHNGGIFSNKSVEYKLVTVFKMLTKIDHHLGGKYTTEIDENRLKAVRWLVGQWEHEAAMAKNNIAQATQLAGKVAELEASLLTLTSQCDGQGSIWQLRATAEQLQPQFDQLDARVGYLNQEAAKRDERMDELAARAAELEAECGRLRSEMQPLKSFHDVWHDSYVYRVYRETLRPWRRLRRRWESAVQARQEAAQSSDVPTKRDAA